MEGLVPSPFAPPDQHRHWGDAACGDILRAGAGCLGCAGDCWTWGLVRVPELTHPHLPPPPALPFAPASRHRWLPAGMQECERVYCTCCQPRPARVPTGEAPVDGGHSSSLSGEGAVTLPGEELEIFTVQAGRGAGSAETWATPTRSCV